MFSLGHEEEEVEPPPKPSKLEDSKLKLDSSSAAVRPQPPTAAPSMEDSSRRLPRPAALPTPPRVIGDDEVAFSDAKMKKGKKTKKKGKNLKDN